MDSNGGGDSGVLVVGVVSKLVLHACAVLDVGGEVDTLGEGLGG